MFNSKILVMVASMFGAISSQLAPDLARELAAGDPAAPASPPASATPVLKCGDTNEKGKETFKTWDKATLCLVFPTFNGGSRKVLFTPRVDKFEVLQIKGLYDIFKTQKEATLSAVSNGVQSRVSPFKVNSGVAEILNLVVKIKNGAIDSMEWKNECIQDVCKFEDCKETKYPIAGTKEEDVDKNCFIQTCKSTKETQNCDTKVYVTWIGNDAENRWCESDNFRVTNFVKHSIRTYFKSATAIHTQAEKAPTENNQ